MLVSVRRWSKVTGNVQRILSIVFLPHIFQYLIIHEKGESNNEKGEMVTTEKGLSEGDCD